MSGNILRHAAVAAALILAGCQGNLSASRQVSRQMERMSPRQLVCQMFVVRPGALSSGYIGHDRAVEDAGAAKDTATVLSEGMRKFYDEYPVGGFCLFADNIVSPSQLLSFNRDLHSLPMRPLLLVDEEGGRVARLANNDSFALRKFGSMKAVADSGDPDDAFAAASYIGNYLARYGFDVDLAPVADVNTNPDNIVIGNRAFSSDPGTASRMVVRYLDGLWAAGICGCLKHFPGHGDVEGDTHAGYVATRKTWEEMLECEMVTFKAGIEHGVRMIMTAHVSTPGISGNDLPATMSPAILGGKLRGELGFKGIIITDGMGMGAIARHYGPGEAAVASIKAGADIILLPKSLPEAVDAVLKAVESGEISMARIKESVRRILELKQLCKGQNSSPSTARLRM